MIATQVLKVKDHDKILKDLIKALCFFFYLTTRESWPGMCAWAPAQNPV